MDEKLTKNLIQLQEFFEYEIIDYLDVEYLEDKIKNKDFELALERASGMKREILNLYIAIDSVYDYLNEHIKEQENNKQ